MLIINFWIENTHAHTKIRELSENQYQFIPINLNLILTNFRFFHCTNILLIPVKWFQNFSQIVPPSVSIAVQTPSITNNTKHTHRVDWVSLKGNPVDSHTAESAYRPAGIPLPRVPRSNEGKLRRLEHSPAGWQSFRCGGHRFIYSGGGRDAFQKLLVAPVAHARANRPRLVPSFHRSASIRRCWSRHGWKQNRREFPTNPRIDDRRESSEKEKKEKKKKKSRFSVSFLRVSSFSPHTWLRGLFVNGTQSV